MSKINATYSSGYYIAPDVDFRKLEEQQRQEQRGKRRAGGADAVDGGDDNVKRQTFAIPFDLICLHCNRRIARGSHVYTNRRATDQRYLDSIRIWELEILCRFCKGKYYLRTDPETPKDTGGYICVKGCKRVEGDFYALNKQNQAAREAWEKAKAEAELDPLAALEKENEAARQLEERNRQIEEEVEQQAVYNDSDLLSMLRSRPRRRAQLANALVSDGSDEDERGKELTSVDPARSSTPSTLGLPPPPTSSSLRIGGDDKGESDSDVADDNGDAEDADERSFRVFEEDMERRWRALEREQRAQRRKQQESATAKPTVLVSEVERVLARYGGGRRTVPSSTDNTGSGGTTEGTSALPLATDLSVADKSCAPQASTSFALPPAPSRHNNKFLAEDEDDEDVLDVRWGERRQRAPAPSARATAPSVASLSASASALPASLTTVRCVVSTAPHGGSASSPKGNALLRNLIDSDSDDDNTSCCDGVNKHVGNGC
jgi:hypothetical protein